MHILFRCYQDGHIERHYCTKVQLCSVQVCLPWAIIYHAEKQLGCKATRFCVVDCRSACRSVELRFNFSSINVRFSLCRHWSVSTRNENNYPHEVSRSPTVHAAIQCSIKHHPSSKIATRVINEQWVEWVACAHVTVNLVCLFVCVSWAQYSTVLLCTTK